MENHSNEDNLENDYFDNNSKNEDEENIINVDLELNE